MKTTYVAYDTCRLYVTDYRHQLSDELFKYVDGALRARDILKLTSLCDRFGGVYHSSTVYRHLMQIEAFFKKNAAFAHADGCEEVAIRNFNKAELFCRVTNKRLEHYFFNPGRLDPDVRKQISRMQSFIRKTLGEYSTFFGNLPEFVKITGGATSTRSRRRSQPYRKIRPNPIATTSAKPILEALIRFYGAEPRVRTREWNRVETVPKNWKTHRTIACEPEGNLPLQLAFDNWTKRRLRSIGIDLGDQSQNQRYAERGSILGHLATLDLSMASDTLSFNAVAWLLPTEWFDYLNAVRARFGKLPNGRLIEYAKFSSMGNGATFALETLIFAAACYAVRPKVFSVYGDDIIIDSSKVIQIRKLLSFFGFRANEDKSFHTGSFRESCGGNYFDGEDVTPFYVRWEPSNKAEFSHLVNGLVTIGLPEGALWAWCKATAASQRLMLGPYQEDTTAYIHVDCHTSYAKGLIRKGKATQNLRIRRYLPVVKKRRVEDSRTLFLWFLYKKAGLTHADLLKEQLNVFRVAKLMAPLGTESVPQEGLRTTSVPILQHKVVHKWVGWYPPAAVTPVHLYWWSDYFFAK